MSYGTCRACGEKHDFPEGACMNCGCPRDACPVCFGDHYSDKTAYCEDCQSEIHVCPECEYSWTDVSRGGICPVCGWRADHRFSWIRDLWWRVRLFFWWVRHGFPKAPF